jgi:hypothetical protein
MSSIVRRLVSEDYFVGLGGIPVFHPGKQKSTKSVHFEMQWIFF